MACASRTETHSRGGRADRRRRRLGGFAAALCRARLGGSAAALCRARLGGVAAARSARRAELVPIFLGITATGSAMSPRATIAGSLDFGSKSKPPWRMIEQLRARQIRDRDPPGLRVHLVDLAGERSPPSSCGIFPDCCSSRRRCRWARASPRQCASSRSRARQNPRACRHSAVASWPRGPRAGARGTGIRRRADNACSTICARPAAPCPPRRDAPAAYARRSRSDIRDRARRAACARCAPTRRRHRPC